MKIKDKGRFIGSIIYFIIGLILLYFSIKMGFFNEAINGFENCPRLLWSLSFALLGFSAIAYRASGGIHENPARKSYFTIYPITLLIISCLVFVFFNAIECVSNYLYYFISASTSFVLAYYIDNLLRFDPLDFIKKILNMDKVTMRKILGVLKR